MSSTQRRLTSSPFGPASCSAKALSVLGVSAAGRSGPGRRGPEPSAERVGGARARRRSSRRGCDRRTTGPFDPGSAQKAREVVGELGDGLAAFRLVAPPATAQVDRRHPVCASQSGRTAVERGVVAAPSPGRRQLGLAAAGPLVEELQVNRVPRTASRCHRLTVQCQTTSIGHSSGSGSAPASASTASRATRETLPASIRTVYCASPVTADLAFDESAAGQTRTSRGAPADPSEAPGARALRPGAGCTHRRSAGGARALSASREPGCSAGPGEQPLVAQRRTNRQQRSLVASNRRSPTSGKFRPAGEPVRGCGPEGVEVPPGRTRGASLGRFDLGGRDCPTSRRSRSGPPDCDRPGGRRVPDSFPIPGALSISRSVIRARPRWAWSRSPSAPPQLAFLVVGRETSAREKTRSLALRPRRPGSEGPRAG